MVVAIIEDDDGMRESLEALLQACGFSVRSYGSAEALLAAGTSGLSVLIIDQNLPGLSGIEMLGRLPAMGRQIPSVLISANLSDKVRREAVSAGVAVSLEKPISLPMLLEALAAFA